jgi:hypothetical protein
MQFNYQTIDTVVKFEFEEELVAFVLFSRSGALLTPLRPCRKSPVKYASLKEAPVTLGLPTELGAARRSRSAHARSSAAGQRRRRPAELQIPRLASCGHAGAAGMDLQLRPCAVGGVPARSSGAGGRGGGRPEGAVPRLRGCCRPRPPRADKGCTARKRPGARWLSIKSASADGRRTQWPVPIVRRRSAALPGGLALRPKRQQLAPWPAAARLQTRAPAPRTSHDPRRGAASPMRLLCWRTVCSRQSAAATGTLTAAAGAAPARGRWQRQERRSSAPSRRLPSPRRAARGTRQRRWSLLSPFSTPLAAARCRGAARGWSGAAAAACFAA